MQEKCGIYSQKNLTGIKKAGWAGFLEEESGSFTLPMPFYLFVCVPPYRQAGLQGRSRRH